MRPYIKGSLTVLATVLWGLGLAAAPFCLADEPVSKKELDARKKIEAKLDKLAELDFKDTRLGDIAEVFTAKQVPVVVDKQALQDAGIILDLRYALKMSNGISYRSVIRMLVEPLGLTYVIGPEEVTITSLTAAVKKLETREYDLKTFGPLAKEGESLVPVIAVMTDGPWEQLDGTGGTIEGKPSLLTVHQHQPGHRQVEHLLNLMKRVNSPRMAPETREELMEARWLENLNRTADFECKDLQLTGVMEKLGYKHEIFFWINGRALGSQGTDDKSLITGNYSKRPVKEILKEILEPLKCTYVVDHECVLITSQKDAEKRFQVRCFPALKLSKTKDKKEILDALHEVEDVRWEDRDGKGGRADVVGNVLIVRQTREGFEKLNTVLGEKAKPPMGKKSK